MAISIDELARKDYELSKTNETEDDYKAVFKDGFKLSFNKYLKTLPKDVDHKDALIELKQTVRQQQEATGQTFIDDSGHINQSFEALVINRAKKEVVEKYEKAKNSELNVKNEEVNKKAENKKIDFNNPTIRQKFINDAIQGYFELENDKDREKYKKEKFNLYGEDETITQAVDERFEIENIRNKIKKENPELSEKEQNKKIAEDKGNHWTEQEIELNQKTTDEWLIITKKLGEIEEQLANSNLSKSQKAKLSDEKEKLLIAYKESREEYKKELENITEKEQEKEQDKKENIHDSEKQSEIEAFDMGEIFGEDFGEEELEDDEIQQKEILTPPKNEEIEILDEESNILPGLDEIDLDLSDEVEEISLEQTKEVKETEEIVPKVEVRKQEKKEVALREGDIPIPEDARNGMSSLGVEIDYTQEVKDNPIVAFFKTRVIEKLKNMPLISNLFKNRTLTLNAGQTEITDTAQNKEIISEETENKNSTVIKEDNIFAVENYGGSTEQVKAGINKVVENQHKNKPQSGNVKVIEDVSI